MMRKIFPVFAVLIIQVLMLMSISGINLTPSITEKEELVSTFAVGKKSYPIDVKTVGELEAANSISVASTLRSDQIKIIDIIADGTQVQQGDILVKIDPTPFEKRIEELKAKVLENEGTVTSCAQSLEWDVAQVEHEYKTSLFEIESAEMELKKILEGDGPLEISRLQQAMSKAQAKFDEMSNYAKDLTDLEKEGFLLPAEVAQTSKKIQEEKENYESTKLQYETYVTHVFPMLVKKAETALKRTESQLDETEKSGRYRISKAQTALWQSQQQLNECKRQLEEAVYELGMTDIRAPAAGMVVLKEDFRSGQKRKPRVGDMVIRNQTILDLPDLSRMIVKTKVREIDLYKIEVGKNSTIEVDAYPHAQFQGVVDFIGILAISDFIRSADEKNFEIKLLVEQTDPRLRPGMTARAVIHAGEVNEGLCVPIHAVFEENKEHYCYVSSGNGFKKQPIVLGLSNDHWVEVYDGLEEDDQVALAKPPEEMIIEA